MRQKQNTWEHKGRNSSLAAGKLPGSFFYAHLGKKESFYPHTVL